MAIRIKDLIDYIQQHPKRDAVWKGWTDVQLCDAIQKAIKDNALCWCLDSEQKLCGIVIGKADVSTKTLHIVGIIGDCKYVMAQFLLVFIKRFGFDWTLTGNRNGKLKKFNTRKLICASKQI